MAHVRDTLHAHENDDDFKAWMEALVPLTDKLLHELAEIEQGAAYVPYPHPHGTLARLWPNKHEMQFGLLPKDLDR
jgi:hypothetical protein